MSSRKFSSWVSLVLLLLFVQLVYGFQGYKEKDGIYQLLDREIDEAAKRSGKMILMYYVPWCQHYQSFYPEFLEASKIMAESDFPIKFAMFNINDNEEMTVRHEVFGSPSMKYYVLGEGSRYDGDRTAISMVKWLHNKVDMHAIRIQHLEHLDWLKKESEVVVAYFGEKNQNFDAFKEAAKNFTKTEVTFIYSHNEDLVGPKDKIVIYKNFDEPTVELEKELTFERIRQFVETYRYPVVMPFDFDRAIDRIFTNELPTVVLFSEETDSNEYKEFAAAALVARGQFIFTHTKVKKGLGERLCDYIGIDKKQTPAVWIIYTTGGELFRYHLPRPFTTNRILEFVKDFIDGRLKRELKSEEVPSEQRGFVKEVVGSNYNDVVKRPGVHVMAMIYAPWCIHSSPLIPVWEETARAVSSAENIQFVKIDGTKNEIPGLKVDTYPTLLYYPAQNKTAVKPYSQERKVNAILAFMKDALAEDWDDAYVVY